MAVRLCCEKNIMKKIIKIRCILVLACFLMPAVLYAAGTETAKQKPEKAEVKEPPAAEEPEVKEQAVAPAL